MNWLNDEEEAGEGGWVASAMMTDLIQANKKKQQLVNALRFIECFW